MAKIDDGGLAFPGSRYQQVGTLADHGVRDDYTPTFGEVQHPGMSLRDWFAGHALAVAWSARDKGYYDGDDRDMAKCAYQVADAMLKARGENS